MSPVAGADSRAASACRHWLGKPLVGELVALFTARRGDYRVIDSIDDAAGVVTVHRIQHRRPSRTAGRSRS
ncbi:MAG: type II toxin-antitoxin system RelE family toxin [Acidimicrobiales bacterium]